MLREERSLATEIIQANRRTLKLSGALGGQFLDVATISPGGFAVTAPIGSDGCIDKASHSRLQEARVLGIKPSIDTEQGHSYIYDYPLNSRRLLCGKLLCRVSEQSPHSMNKRLTVVVFARLMLLYGVTSCLIRYSSTVELIFQDCRLAVISVGMQLDRTMYVPFPIAHSSSVAKPFYQRRNRPFGA